MLIGLTGKMGSGKDTVCEMLHYIASPPVIRDAFADRLKISAARALGISADSDQGLIDWCNELKENGEIHIADKRYGTDMTLKITGRQYLQWYGTEAHRQVFADDFWISAVLPDLNDKITYGRKGLEGLGKREFILVITDCRFPNEVGAIREAGGTVWKIDRDAVAESAHPSEQEIPGEMIDYVIDNNDTVEALRWNVAEAYSDTLLGAKHVNV